MVDILLNILPLLLSIGLLWLCRRAALWLARRHGLADAATFAADHRDRFRSVWHRQRYTVRALLLLALALVVSAPLWFEFPGLAIAVLLASWVLLGAWFNRTFTVTLNVARGLDPYYVSRSDHPTRFDRFIIDSAKTAGVPAVLQMEHFLKGTVVAAKLLYGAIILFSLGYLCTL